MPDFGIRVLLIEDDGGTAALITTLLRVWIDSRCDVVWARSLVDALPHLTRGDVDVVMVALSLPDSAGPATIERAHVVRRTLPIIAVIDDDSVAEDCIAAGATDVLDRKALSSHTVKRAVTFVLERERRLHTESLKSTLRLYQSLIESRADASSPISEPNTRAALEAHYRAIVDAYVEHQLHEGPSPTGLVRGMASSLADVRAEAQDAVSIHVSVVERAADALGAAGAKDYVMAARLLVLDLVSELALCYREACILVESPPALASELLVRPAESALPPRPDLIRLLLVEDSDADVVLVRALLSRAPPPRCEITHARRLTEATERLMSESFDVAFLDLSLPDSTGIATVEVMHLAAPDLPIIVLTGRDDSIGLECIERGADDFVSKDRARTFTLHRALICALARRRERETGELQVVLERYRANVSGTHTLPPPVARPDGDLKSRDPELSAWALDGYAAVLDGYVRHLDLGGARPAAAMDAIAHALASRGAGARDLMSLHLRALEGRARTANRPERTRAYAVAARILALEMMSKLADAYRARATGLSPAATPT